MGPTHKNQRQILLGPWSLFTEAGIDLPEVPP